MLHPAVLGAAAWADACVAGQVMRDPVVAADGHTYERAGAERWFARHGAVSMVTGAPLPHTHLVPNQARCRLPPAPNPLASLPLHRPYSLRLPFSHGPNPDRSSPPCSPIAAPSQLQDDACTVAISCRPRPLICALPLPPSLLPKARNDWRRRRRRQAVRLLIVRARPDVSLAPWRPAAPPPPGGRCAAAAGGRS